MFPRLVSLKTRCISCGDTFRRVATHPSRRKIVFGGATIGTFLASYSQFSLEPHKGDPKCKKTFRQKYGNILQMHSGKPLLASIIAANVLVFLAWRWKPDLMKRHFLCNIENVKAKRYHVLFTSNWSHMDWWHVGLNMYVLWNFGDILISVIGIPSFSVLYVSAGLVGSAGSLLWHQLSRHAHYSSLGASSCLLGVISAFAFYAPDSRFQLIFLPGFTFSALHGVMGLVALDTAGILMGWRFLDHAAHLGGTLCGYGAWNYMRRANGTSDNAVLPFGHSKYIFEGAIEDFKPCDGYGTVYSPTKTYRGELTKGQYTFHGKGCIRNEKTGEVFYGMFAQGKPIGVGLFHDVNDKVHGAIFNAETGKFETVENFHPREIENLLHSKMESGEETDNSNSDSGEKDTNGQINDDSVEPVTNDLTTPTIPHT